MALIPFSPIPHSSSYEIQVHWGSVHTQTNPAFLRGFPLASGWADIQRQLGGSLHRRAWEQHEREAGYAGEIAINGHDGMIPL